MADTMKMEYKIFLEAEDVSQSRILSCASYMKRVLESCNNPYISRAELDDESDLDDFVLRLFVEEGTNPAMAESFIEDMAELVTGIAEAHSFLDLEGSFSVTWKGTTSAYAFVSPGGDDGCDFQELGVTE